MKTARQAAEAAKEVARVRLMNAHYHADQVRGRFGLLSHEYGIACAVVTEAQRDFVAACDVLVGIYAGTARAS